MVNNINTRFKVIDNSGAFYVKCIKVYSKSKEIKIGDILLVSVRKVNTKNKKRKISKGQLVKAVVVRLVNKTRKRGGYISFEDNAVILLNNKLLPLGTRILGTISSELYFYAKFNKILSMSTYII